MKSHCCCGIDRLSQPGECPLPSRLGLTVALLLLAACSSSGAYWGSTPQYVRNQLDAADRQLARGDAATARQRYDQLAATGHPEALIRAGRAWLAQPDADPERARAHFEAAWGRSSDRRNQAGVWLAQTIAADDPERAIEILETVEGRGEPRAAGELAKLLAAHHPEDPRLEGLWRRAADEGDVGALLTLARDYRDDEAVGRAVDTLQSRHEAGDAFAANHLARLHAADGPLPDAEREVAWLHRGAERGHPAAMLNYGRALLAGEVVTRDPVRGIAWLRRAAEVDNPWAQLELGRRLTRGDGIERDPREGRMWLERAAAQGNQAAERALSDL